MSSIPFAPIQSPSQAPSQSPTKRPIRQLRSRRGQSLIEYIILVALVGVATIGVVRVLGQAVSSRYATITYALQGKKSEPAVDNIEDSQLRKKDLGNFNDGVGSR
jgi:Flp pilus assembly pilin Flp